MILLNSSKAVYNRYILGLQKPMTLHAMDFSPYYLFGMLGYCTVEKIKYKIINCPIEFKL